MNMRIVKVDIACDDPNHTADCYGALTGHAVHDLGNGCFQLDYGGTILFFCSKQMSGAPADAVGVHQLHLHTHSPFEDLIKIAESKGLRHEMVQYGPNPSLCIWDVENNPIIFNH